MIKDEIINIIYKSFKSKSDFCLKSWYNLRELERKFVNFSDKLSPELLNELQELEKLNNEYLKIQNYDIIEFVIDFYKSFF